MKIIKWLLCAGLIAVAGCHKSDTPSTGSVQTIDASRLRPAFSSATPEVRATVDEVMTSLQLSNPAKALAELEKLANNPSLTEPQKKVVSDLMEQIKKRPSSGQ
jgi:hypothetical protein